jgi:hypothetical protein
LARYVAEAQEQLTQAMENTRRSRDSDIVSGCVSEADERQAGAGVEYTARENGLAPLNRNLE